MIFREVLLSLGIMFSRFGHVVASVVPFLLSNNIPLSGFITFCLSTTFEPDYGQFGIRTDKNKKKLGRKQRYKKIKILRTKIQFKFTVLKL